MEVDKNDKLTKKITDSDSLVCKSIVDSYVVCNRHGCDRCCMDDISKTYHAT